MNEMRIDEFLELVKMRRSIRRFRPDPIPDAYIEKIIEAARWAMSGANGQPWEFVVVRDRKKRDGIADSYIEVRKEQYLIEQTHMEEFRHPQLAAMPEDIPGLREAPVVMVVLGDRRTLQASSLAGNYIPPSPGPSYTYISNMAFALHNLHLPPA